MKGLVRQPRQQKADGGDEEPIADCDQMARGEGQRARRARRGEFVWFIWSAWFIAQGNQIDQKNQMDKRDERVHGLRYETRAEMTAASFEYIEVFYNRKRRHSTLGYKSPMQCLDDWLMAQQYEKLVT